MRANYERSAPNFPRVLLARQQARDSALLRDHGGIVSAEVPRMFSVSLLVCSALLCVSPPIPAPAQNPAPAAPTKAAPAELVYPTFEPFLASRMFAAMVGAPAKLDLKLATEQMKKMNEAGDRGKAAGEKVAPPKPADAPSAALAPAAPAHTRGVYGLVPAVLLRLKPLWETREWNADQLAAAVDAAAFFASVPDAPKLAFAKEKPAENHAELEQLVRWFHAQVAKPELYAAMILTFDDGPFAGLPYEAAAPLPVAQTKTLDEKTELRLCKVERAKEPWVLQCVRDGKVLWSRVVSGAPDESVAEVTFRDSKPQPLGAYGWKVFLQVKWSYGNEACYLYLGTDAQLLFYFLSW